MSFNMQGKSAVVLGVSGSGSIGYEIAQQLVTAGAKVMIAARTEATLQAAAETLGCQYTVCDITNSGDPQALADKAIKQFGQLDMAINCSGIQAPSAISDVTFEEANSAAQIIFLGTLFFIQAMAQAMQGDKTGSNPGSIVTISSITASLAMAGNAAYLGAKAGADHLVRSAALEYGANNIKVNSVSPGFTDDTPMSREYLTVPGLRETFEKEIPLGRLNTANDVAHAVLWLCDENSYVTGQNLQVNGGNSLSRLPSMAEMNALFA